MLENENILSNLKKHIDITKIPEYVEQAKNFIPTLKTLFPLIKEWENNYQLEKNQKVIYTLIMENDSFAVFVLVIQLNADGSTNIVKELHQYTFEELIKNLPSILQGGENQNLIS